jgi:DHA3 family macrolide efflux protein-like MFS transporter
MSRERVCAMENSATTPAIRSETGKTGMLAFTIIWIGQMFSLLGTAMTQFALTIWAWELTGQATALALVGFFGLAPLVLVSPLAGAIVDRYDRKKVMMLADLAAGLPTVVVLMLYVSGNLQIWHLYVTGAFSGTFQAFHFPAYSAAVTMMLPKKQYGRANGMLAAAQFASTIFAPIAAVLLLVLIGIPGVLMIDIFTFILAISMLFLVHIPRPSVTEAGRKGMGSIWKESLYGFRYIHERPSLLGLLLIFFVINFIATFSFSLLAPMILSRTANNQIILGSVLSASGVGGVVGSIVLSVWGGPKRKVHGVLIGLFFESLFGMLLFGLGREFVVWAVFSFSAMFILPIINGSSQAIWQAKVAPDVQGRVFSTRLLIAQISSPAALLLTGPLADRFFEPAMMPSGVLANVFGLFVGTGKGAGMALMFVITGVLGMLISLAGYAFRVVRDAEKILSDYDSGPSSRLEKKTE